MNSYFIVHKNNYHFNTYLHPVLYLYLTNDGEKAVILRVYKFLNRLYTWNIKTGEIIRGQFVFGKIKITQTFIDDTGEFFFFKMKKNTELYDVISRVPFFTAEYGESCTYGKSFNTKGKRPITKGRIPVTAHEGDKIIFNDFVLYIDKANLMIKNNLIGDHEKILHDETIFPDICRSIICEYINDKIMILSTENDEFEEIISSN
ncbi:MAG: hypothetical protein PHG66_00325 [Candidatus Colwellbacteria bacterium]|nr:hypothetical protein [Candidatus Colwellbacteria bacterium]